MGLFPREHLGVSQQERCVTCTIRGSRIAFLGSDVVHVGSCRPALLIFLDRYHCIIQDGDFVVAVNSIISQ